MINILGIIPARYASSRFPGKPLVDIRGKSMIQRVYEQVVKSKRINRVIVATDDQKIFDHVQHWGGEVQLTKASHLTGTDRIAEVISSFENEDNSIVVNIQGDEPFIQPSQIDQLCEFMINNSHFSIGTLAKKITDSEQLLNPNVVKVVFNQHQKGLYFSRSPIPFQRNKEQDQLRHHDYYKHIGLYAFKIKTLLTITQLPIGNLEKTESLEQLRWLEAGYDIGVTITDFETQGIDTPEDLLKL